MHPVPQSLPIHPAAFRCSLAIQTFQNKRQRQYAASHRAVRELKPDGSLPADTKLRSSRYLNNLIEQDHRGVKQRIAVMLGFKGLRNAAITIAGIELMHRIRKGQFGLGHLGVQGRACSLERGCLGLEVSTPQRERLLVPAICTRARLAKAVEAVGHSAEKIAAYLNEDAVADEGKR
jgi:hypothetical protein